jgi:hypothetical protein
MGNFKFTIGLLCFVAALVPGFLAFVDFSFWPASGFYMIPVIFAVGLVSAGRYLIKKRASSIPKKAAIMIAVAIPVCLLLPADMLWRLAHLDSRNRTGEAMGQAQRLAQAIIFYKEEFGHFPIPTNIANLSNKDFTFGTYNTAEAALGITNTAGYQANNSKIVAILLAWTNCIDFVHTINIKTEFPCISTNGVLLDPWGHPYIITLDLNGDNKCRDAFYQLAKVSETDSSPQGLNDFTRPTPLPYQSSEARDSFEVPGEVMVWSFGPDGKANRAKKANASVNKDNIMRIE